MSSSSPWVTKPRVEKGEYEWRMVPMKAKADDTERKAAGNT